MNETKICNKCLIEKPITQFYKGKKQTRSICNKCHAKYNRTWNHNNPIKSKLIERNKRIRLGFTTMDTNSKCPGFLGIHIAEQLLSKVYDNVLKQPNGNKGFDFICDHGKKIDVKAACLYKCKTQKPYWNFNINKNTISDFFLCLAFDDRTHLTPLHIWLLPSQKFNHLSSTGIAITKINKWDEYKLNINKVTSCWDSLKPILYVKGCEQNE